MRDGELQLSPNCTRGDSCTTTTTLFGLSLLLIGEKDTAVLVRNPREGLHFENSHQSMVPIAVG